MLVNVFSFLKIQLGYIFCVTKTRDHVFYLIDKNNNILQNKAFL